MTKDLDAGLALFMDMLRNPGFDEGRLKLAKSQTLQGLERRNDSTISIEQREFARLLRGDKHFSTKPVTKATLEAISRQDLIDFHDEILLPVEFRARGFRRLRYEADVGKTRPGFGQLANKTKRFPIRQRLILLRSPAFTSWIRKTSIKLGCGWGIRA